MISEENTAAAGSDETGLTDEENAGDESADIMDGFSDGSAEEESSDISDEFTDEGILRKNWFRHLQKLERKILHLGVVLILFQQELMKM